MQTLTSVDRDPVALDTESPSVKSPVLAFRRLNGEVSAAGLVVGGTAGLVAARRRRLLLTRNAARAAIVVVIPASSNPAEHPSSNRR